jgi:predicted ATP-grasp superfamily ATP-dependent carboligase
MLSTTWGDSRRDAQIQENPAVDSAEAEKSRRKPSRRTLVILGASVRQVAESAFRAGFRPYCGDLFADEDLIDRFHAQRCENYPAGLRDIAQLAPAGRWMYTGGLENHPDLVDCIGRDRPLLGNPGRVLRRVRDPIEIYRALTAAGMPCPDVADDVTGVPCDGSWLQKPRASAGGTRITPWFGGDGGSAAERRWYYQRNVAGMPASAAYVASAGRATLLAATEQWIGADWTGGSGFRYCGSIGPLRLDEAVGRQLVHLGDVLTRSFGLVGLFGVDGVLADGVFWPVEVNPRFTASLEVLERSLGFTAVGLHVAGCQGKPIEFDATCTRAAAWPDRQPNDESTIPWTVAKAVIYAHRQVEISAAFSGFLQLAPQRFSRSWVADVPRERTVIAAGWPVVTLLAEGRTRESAERRLQQLAARVQRVLYRGGPVRTGT